jgi:HSP20 family molecular chaperone IbpA
MSIITYSYPWSSTGTNRHANGVVDPFKFFDFFDPMRDNLFFGDTRSTDVREDEKSFYIELATPGIAKELLSVEVLENKITISYSGYKRTWRLEKGTDASLIKADYKDGLLKVVIPKVVPPKPTPVQITIS